MKNLRNLNEKKRVTGRRKRRRVMLGAIVAVVAFVVAGAVFLVLGGGKVGVQDILIEQRPDPAYEHLFPYYVDLCVTSQYESKTKGRGGPAGHALMYIKGACRNEGAEFPQLRRCRSLATSTDDPEHGVGVSVNQWLRNANWLPIPGHDLFYTGNLERGERLTQEHFDATVRQAIDQGAFDGVELHEDWASGDDSSLQDFVATNAIGTDFALQFARTTFCARMPVTSPMIDEIIAFLNDKNREYATGDVDYNWSGVYDNCVHTVRNALAAANVWSPISVRATKLWHLLNMAVPANEVVNLAALGAEGPLEDYREIQQEGPLRDAFHEFRWLPTRHGALMKVLPVGEPNDLFDTRFRLFSLQSPFRQGKRKTAIRLLSDERFVDLRANLEYFRDLYDQVLETHYEDFDGLASVRGTPYRRVQRLHYEYIKEQRAEVEELLERLTEIR